MKFRIMGKGPNQSSKEIETTESYDEAETIKAECLQAFGAGWNIWIVSPVCGTCGYTVKQHRESIIPDCPDCSPSYNG